ncbi:MAG: hypothetical protein AAF532_17125 [Planctomycetota bacterium]
MPRHAFLLPALAVAVCGAMPTSSADAGLDDLLIIDLFHGPAPDAPLGHLTPLPPGTTAAGYPDVCYEDLHNIHPCAVPALVTVLNPCPPPVVAPVCGCECECPCEPPVSLVEVLVCVPSCECPEVVVKKAGHFVKLDYGKYEVEITVKRGKVFVDYDD